jgi:transcriptional regulator with XRE-family HTH domain
LSDAGGDDMKGVTNEDLTKFSGRLRAAMESSGITIQSLALESGYSTGYIDRLRNGQQENPTIMCVECLATVLHKNPAFLAGWENDS